MVFADESGILLIPNVVRTGTRVGTSSVIPCGLSGLGYLPITSMGTVMVRGGMQEFRSQA